jgi:hypothetical protein
VLVMKRYTRSEAPHGTSRIARQGGPPRHDRLNQLPTGWRLRCRPFAAIIAVIGVGVGVVGVLSLQVVRHRLRVRQYDGLGREGDEKDERVARALAVRGNFLAGIRWGACWRA